MSWYSKIHRTFLLLKHGSGAVRKAPRPDNNNV
ncbi:hypothetical protein FOQG_01878 [Fusarium oxysporum f. sp. raphani 54005]|uniref:Uncharacterized protein n=2 Tax=Fusarium oxysporum TaxID=5507 RepID=X0CXU9_FUSOX|nr:hypothetical protein FOVG_09725 [Fusarium oxysporum f. sp. pisi HDV247]EXK99335.1 hypothetical protein FOQG_01878 [Fusarium oxysporum f. sp. raphani 54005]